MYVCVLYIQGIQQMVCDWIGLNVKVVAMALPPCPSAWAVAPPQPAFPGPGLPHWKGRQAAGQAEHYCSQVGGRLHTWILPRLDPGVRKSRNPKLKSSKLILPSPSWSRSAKMISLSSWGQRWNHWGCSISLWVCFCLSGRYGKRWPQRPRRVC